MRQSPFSFQRGYSLIEMITVISIFSMLSAMVFGFVVFLYRTHANAIEQAIALSSARQGVTQLSEAIRNAEPGVEGSYPIHTIDPYAITIFTTLQDGNPPARVRYFIDNGTLMRGVIEPSGSPAGYVVANEVIATSTEYIRNIESTTPLFVYYASDGSEITDMSDILAVRFVRIDMVANVNPIRAPEEFLLRSSVALRNLKDNL